MNRRKWWVWSFSAVSMLMVAVSVLAMNRDQSIPVSTFRIVAEYPHDPKAFTQGLVFHKGMLFEGTGLEGQSSLRRVELQTGRTQFRMNLNKPYFGEGIAIHDRKIYQLTWQNHRALVYDLETMDFLKSIRYSGEGWGLTTDGKSLIISDGSATLKFVDPNTFEVQKKMRVKAGWREVDKLNELEYIHGEIWANIWYSDRIARISPATGEVIGWIDLSALYPLKKRDSKEHVLNGIAYDADDQRIFVTGKNWPKLYEIAVESR